MRTRIGNTTLLAAAILCASAIMALSSEPTVVTVGKHGTILRKDGRMILDSNPTGSLHYSPSTRHQGLVTIFDNLAHHYPDSVYFCCEGLLVTGPTAFPGFFPEFQEAAGFTPRQSLRVTEIDVPIGWSSGTNGAEISLYAGEFGLPSILLKKWSVKDIPLSGSCCAPVVVTSEKGIPVKAGFQYFITVSAGARAPDANLGWQMNTTEQVFALPQATWCSDDISQSGICGDTNDIWANSTSVPSPAFAVYGH